MSRKSSCTNEVSKSSQEFDVPASSRKRDQKALDKKSKKVNRINYEKALSTQESEHSLDGEVHKCSCKKSKCLKMYCECFAKGKVCGKECGCVDCCNGEDKEERELARNEILLKNPSAFQSKVVENG
mmetsp:Transcript_34641/g.25788  ORF Transcript_34641/g.25788 Transcript_34641/m.25788 type:complete len:127 (-) Transcript_34641:85-465(-)